MRNYILNINILFITTLLFSLSFGQTNWTKYPGNPVLRPGSSGEWDEQKIGISSVLFDGSTYHMWYSASVVGDYFKSIGYATSLDGTIWTKNNDPSTSNPPFAESDPVLNPGTAGSWDDDRVALPCVILIDTLYHMWYTGADNPDPNEGAIGHAISSDGISWEKDADNPVLNAGSSGSWDDVWVWDPSVVFDGSIYHMWYHAWNGVGEEVQIGHATSPHPDSVWTKDPNNPVLNWEYGSWDYPRVQAPCVIYNGNIFHIWYSAGPTSEYSVGYAKSVDGSEWEKSASNPVLEAGSAGSWDDTMVGFCTVIDSADSIYKMWYTGGNSAGQLAVGYAESDIIDGLRDNLLNKIPLEPSLSQNYPNPFNPITAISYRLSAVSHVDLSIYNVLGQKVATLVDKKQPAGSHQVQWDASGFSTGVYYYKLKTEKFQQIKKMILIK